MVSIFSVSKKESSYCDSMDKDENSPLLSGSSVKATNEGIHEEMKEMEEQPKQKDFQTIQVPGSGQAVREYYRYSIHVYVNDCVMQTT